MAIQFRLLFLHINEESALSDTVSVVMMVAQRLGLAYEATVINDGSSDNMTFPHFSGHL